MKPTDGYIAKDGIVPISADFDSAGPIARCPRDIAMMMDAMVDRKSRHTVGRLGPSVHLIALPYGDLDSNGHFAVLVGDYDLSHWPVGRLYIVAQQYGD